MISPETTAEKLNQESKGSIIDHLGIEFLEVGKDFVSGKMPVDERTKQPFGILHGGASVTLAETLGSWGATATIDLEKQYCVGLDINANHIKAMTEGFVYGTARPLHLGRSTQVWEIRIENEEEQLVAICRLTMAIINKK